MSKEIKKEVQDAELNPEKLDKVAGGFIIDQNKIYTCPKCGGQFKGMDYYVHSQGCGAEPGGWGEGQRRKN